MTLKENPLLTGMKIIANGDPISVGIDEIKDVAEKSLAAYEDWKDETVEILKEIDSYLSEERYNNGKPVHLNSIGAFSVLHQKIRKTITQN